MARATRGGDEVERERGAELAPRPTLADVLQLIWRERQITRADIARRQDLSRSTVSIIVDELLASGLVREVGAGESRGGRRPIVLQFGDDAAVILGVDLGATHVSATLTNLRGLVLAWEHRAHPVRDDPAGALAAATELAERCIEGWGGRRALLLGVGVSVPSPVDPARPDQLNEVVIPRWKGVSVGQPFRKRFRVPVLLDNDANLGALAERWWGAGRDVDDFAYVKLATGVGAGFFVDGKIYRGARGVAGEIGHMSIDPAGEPCGCGLRGCLHTFVGTPALVRRARQLAKAHRSSALAAREVDLGAVEAAALAGDGVAVQVIREAAEHLGVAVAGLVNLLNPSAVILGGGLVRLGELLLEPLRQTVRARTLASSVDQARIVASELGARAIAVGAATLLLQRALADPRHFPAAARR
jgi:glucokinase-like ROK family protein